MSDTNTLNKIPKRLNRIENVADIRKSMKALGLIFFPKVIKLRIKEKLQIHCILFTANS